MKEFDYIIIGGGCSGLSLAYELEITSKLKDKTLAIVETRDKYQKDKTWSFWRVFDHNFEDCIKKSWNNFSVNLPKKTRIFNSLIILMKLRQKIQQFSIVFQILKIQKKNYGSTSAG